MTDIFIESFFFNPCKVENRIQALRNAEFWGFPAKSAAVLKVLEKLPVGKGKIKNDPGIDGFEKLTLPADQLD